MCQNIIYRLLANKSIQIQNLELEAGIIKSSNGVLSRYTSFGPNGEMLSRNAMTVLAKSVEGDIYTVASPQGKVVTSTNDKIIQYLRSSGSMISNGRVSRMGNKEFIASIAGEYPKFNPDVTKKRVENRNIQKAPANNRILPEEVVRGGLIQYYDAITDKRELADKLNKRHRKLGLDGEFIYDAQSGRIVQTDIPVRVTSVSDMNNRRIWWRIELNIDNYTDEFSIRKLKNACLDRMRIPMNKVIGTNGGIEICIYCEGSRLTVLDLGLYGSFRKEEINTVISSNISTPKSKVLEFRGFLQGQDGAPKSGAGSKKPRGNVGIL